MNNNENETREGEIIRIDSRLRALAKIEAAKDSEKEGKNITLKDWVSKLIRAELERRGVKVE